MTDGMRCDELVELVTDYLEERLPGDERRRFEQHLTICPGCVDYLEQIRITLRLAEEDRAREVTALVEQLLPAFRSYRRTPR